MESLIYVVGIGPGSPDFVPPVASKVIASAAAVVGSRRALDTFASPEQKCCVIQGTIEKALDWIEQEGQRQDIAVLVSGDPGFYSLLIALRRRFKPERLRVIPGISSVQLAFARLGEVWQDAELVSLHGRQAPTEFWQWHSGRKVAFLTDAHYCPAVIAANLVENGWPRESQVWLCERLSYDNEQILALSLEETLQTAGYEACVMVVKQ